MLPLGKALEKWVKQAYQPGERGKRNWYQHRQALELVTRWGTWVFEVFVIVYIFQFLNRQMEWALFS